MNPAQKNIVIIMSDEQSWGTLGFQGNRAAVTPHLNALAADGISMDRCYTPYPLCCPARSSLWTGLMPHQHEVVGNWRYMREDLREGGLIADFQEAGYHTVYCGKWHVPGTTPARLNFEDYSAIPAVVNGQDRGRHIESYQEYARSKGYQIAQDRVNATQADLEGMNQPGKAPVVTSEIPLEHYLETWQTEQFISALERRENDNRPFFAVCSYNAPHYPMIVPAPFDSLVSPENVELQPNFRKGMEGKPSEVLESHYYTEFQHLDDSEWRRFIAFYLGYCALIDHQAGTIIEYLKRNQLYEDTIIVFVSDHGDMMGAHGLIEKGFPLHYEEALRVPCIIAGAEGIARGSREQLVSLHDLLPTLAELTGVPLKREVEGKSFASLLTSPEAAPIRPYVVAETYKLTGPNVHPDMFNSESDSLNLSIRTATHKYIFRYQDIEELYDMREDPFENVNMAGNPESANRLKYMRGLLLAELESSSHRYRHLIYSKIKD